MRIAFVTPEYVTENDSFDGGLANYLYRVAISLVSFNCEPIIIVGSFENNSFTHNGIQIHRVKVNKNELASKYWIEQSLKLNSYLFELNKKEKIDIIQYASYTGTGFFRIWDIPSTIRISSYHPLWVQNYDIPWDSDTIQQIKIERDALEKTDALYGPSSKIAIEISKNYNLKCDVIEPPFFSLKQQVDYSIFNEVFKGEKYFLFYGTIGLLKGCKAIADSLQQLFQKYPDYKFYFIGKNSSYSNSTMVDYIVAKAGKWEQNIVFIDKLPQNQLIPFIENSFCVILPSRIDNFPNTCIEAMSLGKIVIGTYNTGFEQLIINGENGFLCEPDNSNSLLEAIDRVFKLSDEAKNEIILKAKNRISCLDPEIKTNELIGFYNNVIMDFYHKRSEKSNEKMILDTIYLQIIKNREFKIEMLEKQILEQIDHISRLYNSKSYQLGNKLINLFKKKF